MRWLAKLDDVALALLGIIWGITIVILTSLLMIQLASLVAPKTALVLLGGWSGVPIGGTIGTVIACWMGDKIRKIREE